MNKYLFVLVLLTRACCAHASVTHEALLQISLALSGHSWDLPAASRWNESYDYCSWHGVRCCGTQTAEPSDDVVHLQHGNLAVSCGSAGDVIALELQNLHIVASAMPWDAIGKLKTAVVLNISGNSQLTGDVSGLPSSLSILDAHGTQLTIHDKSSS